MLKFGHLLHFCRFKCPDLSIYINYYNHSIYFISCLGTMLHVLKLHLKFQINRTSSSSVIIGSKLENPSNCVICIISVLLLFLQLLVLISHEPVAWLKWNFRWRLTIYSMVLPRKMKLIRWLKQFLHMLKYGHFWILAYFDATFNLWTWITKEPLVWLS